MLRRYGALLIGAVAGITQAEQPGAAKPDRAPEIRDLTWGQLNFLHTTDTHGWHAGHLQEPQYSADWGDYVSFAEHMRKKADDRGADLLLIDTGDRVEGNGLYDASDPKGKYTSAIFAAQDVDVICSGNHELYRAETAAREANVTIPNFGDRYVASNLDYIDPATGEQRPLANRYRRFKTKNLGVDVLAFGFLFDFTGNANNTVVIPVKQAVKEDWFQEAIRMDPDVFVVTGHVGLRMEEQKVIIRAIREANWNSPVLFFAGHAHVRDAVDFESRAFGIASGRYFETIGWMSIDGIPRIKGNADNKVDKAEGEGDVSASAFVTFSRRYIDNNLQGMYHHTGLDADSFPTDKGRNVSEQITRAREALDLDYRFGCAPKTLWLTRAPHDSPDSVFTWIKDEVLPDVATKEGREDKPRLAIFNTGGIRFDVFEGAFTRDSTYLVSPFISTLKYIPDVPYGLAKQVIDLLNSGGPVFPLSTKYLAQPERWAGKDVERDIPLMPGLPKLELRHAGEEQHRLGGDDEGKPVRTQGYTTEDDVGKDGDDTVHDPVPYHNVPNCIQSEIAFPEGGEEPVSVDLVFIEFLTPWIVTALKFVGAGYGEKDVRSYTDETFTELMGGWVKEHWTGEC